MKMLAFSARNAKEIIRDPINLAFGLGFPIVVLLLLSAIQAKIPVDLFTLDRLTPGIAVFGLSFVSLFSGMLIAKDRTSAYMLRLFASPLTAADFIFGYTLPLLPMALGQMTVCFLAAFVLGLQISVGALMTVVVLIPTAVLFIAIGLLCGSVFTDRQVGGICGALLTNLSAWLSGTWFDVDLVGGAFQKIAGALPFIHAVNAGRAALGGNYSAVFPDLWWVIAYAAVLTAAAVLVFTRKMNGDSI